MANRGDILHLNVEIEVISGKGSSYARLLIGGVDVFSEFVLDTDPSGRRTVEWARLNLLTTFGERLKRALDPV